MDIKAYLRRIGYDGSREPSLNTLRALHVAHLRTVPFENLDIRWGRSIVLDHDLLFDKIVSRHRGGFCYELNGLFAALLRQLGFNVTLLSARVAGKEQRLGPEFDHLTLLVDLDGPWVADVGFGDCFLEPLRLQDGYEDTQQEVKYRLEHRQNGLWAVMCCKVQEPDWQLQYVFTLVPRSLADFSEMCVWQQKSPDSHFTRTTVCTRVTEQGRITLSESRLIVTENGIRTEREIGANEIGDVLRKSFGITEDGRELAVSG